MLPAVPCSRQTTLAAEDVRPHSIHGASDFSRTRGLISLKVVRSSEKVCLPTPPTSSAESTPSEPAAQACYICFGCEGPMLVNVCSCKWSRVHASCLDEMLRASDKFTCGVCKDEISHEPSLSTTARLWNLHPFICYFQLVASATAVIIGLASFFVGALANYAENKPGKVDVPLIVIGLFLVGYAGSNLALLLNEGTSVMPGPPTTRQNAEALARPVRLMAERLAVHGRLLHGVLASGFNPATLSVAVQARHGTV